MSTTSKANKVKQSFASVCPGFFVQIFFPSKIPSVTQTAPLESSMGWWNLAWARKQKRLSISLPVPCPRNSLVFNRTASKHHKPHAEKDSLKMKMKSIDLDEKEGPEEI